MPTSSPTAPSASASAGGGGGALTDEEMREAFGSDLGAGPGAKPSAEAPGAPQENQEETQTPASISVREGTPTWAEFQHGWEIGLYRDPVTCAVFAGVVLGALGVFVVLRRAVFVTAAVSQAAGLGVALAFLLQVKFGVSFPPALGALILALLATALLTVRIQRMRLPRETLVGVTYLAASAGAILVGDRILQEAHDIAGILFGTAVLVRPIDLALVIAAGLFTLLVLALAFRGLLFAGFDPEAARVHRLPVQLLEFLLWFLVAIEVSVTTRAIGALPVFAFAVLPAMAALALVERVRWALVLAAVLGGLSGGLGYVFAFFYEFPVGASQAALATALLIVSLPIARVLRGSAV